MSNALMVAFNKSIAVEFDAKLARGQLKTVPFTSEQSAFIQTFREQSSSLLGEAVAGSGKTHTLLAAALSLPNISWTVKTMHGLGYGAWQSKIGKRLTVRSNKLFGLVKEMNSDDPIESEDFSPIMKLATIGKTHGIVPKSLGRGNSLFEDDEDTWEELAENYDCDINPYLLNKARELLVHSINSAKSGLLDFDDMLYMPVCFSGVFTRYPLVLVDEAQDLSSIQHEMLSRVIARKNGILVGCGDRHQAIYGFRGALSESIPKMISDFSMVTRPLTVSFRCPKSVVREAQKQVPHIQPFDEAIEGEVITHDERNALTLETIPPVVLCRNTAPIVTLALHLIAGGRGATIAGREMGKMLGNMIKRISSAPVSLDVFEEKLSLHIHREIAKRPRSEATLRDKEAAIKAICEQASSISGGHATSDTLIDIVEKLYGKAAVNGVHLSTIHRAKGLEWPEVLILDPQLMPSCYTKLPWQFQQEDNLRYVGVTRAQQTLRYTTSDDLAI